MPKITRHWWSLDREALESECAILIRRALSAERNQQELIRLLQELRSFHKNDYEDFGDTGKATLDRVDEVLLGVETMP